MQARVGTGTDGPRSEREINVCGASAESRRSLPGVGREGRMTRRTETDEASQFFERGYRKKRDDCPGMTRSLPDPRSDAG